MLKKEYYIEELVLRDADLANRWKRIIDADLDKIVIDLLNDAYNAGYEEGRDDYITG